jgi:hypothetical protein
MNDVDNSILLLFSSSCYRSVSRAHDGKISAPTSIPEPFIYAFVRPLPFPSTVIKRVGPVHRLHVHGFPRWSYGLNTICSILRLHLTFSTLYIDLSVGLNRLVQFVSWAKVRCPRNPALVRRAKCQKEQKKEAHQVCFRVTIFFVSWTQTQWAALYSFRRVYR